MESTLQQQQVRTLQVGQENRACISTHAESQKLAGLQQEFFLVFCFSFLVLEVLQCLPTAICCVSNCVEDPFYVVESVFVQKSSLLFFPC